jgi:hypothetical protein
LKKIPEPGQRDLEEGEGRRTEEGRGGGRREKDIAGREGRREDIGARKGRGGGRGRGKHGTLYESPKQSSLIHVPAASFHWEPVLVIEMKGFICGLLIVLVYLFVPIITVTVARNLRRIRFGKVRRGRGRRGGRGGRGRRGE